MIGMTIDGQFIELFPDINYDVTENSALYSDTFVEENSVYNFPVPRGKNDEVFGFPARLTNANIPKKNYECHIYIDNNRELSGTAVVKGIKKNYIEIAVGLKESGFYYAVRNKLITDYNYTKEYYNYDRAYELEGSICNVADKIFPEANFAIFPVKNLSLFDETYFEEIWRAFDTNNSPENYNRPFQNSWKSFVGFDVETQQTYLYYNVFQVTPFPYIGYIIESIFLSEGYNIEYNIFRENNYLRRLCIYNPNLIAKMTPDPDGPPLFQIPEYYIFDAKNHLPGISVSDLIMTLKNIGVTVDINDISKKVTITSIKNISAGIVRNLKNYFIDDVFIPEFSSRKIKVAISSDDTDSYYSDNVKPDDIESPNYRGAFPQYSSLANISNPLLNDIARVNEGHLWWMRDVYYIYQKNDEGVFNWEYLAYDAGNKLYFDGDETYTHTLNFSFMWTRRFMEFFYNANEESIEGYWFTPEVGVKGNLRNEAIDRTVRYRDFGLKLAFYLGFCQTSIGTKYPLGTSDIFDEMPIDIPVSEQKSLIPNHTNAIYDDFLMDYFRTLSRDRKIKILKPVSKHELKTINFIDEYYLEGRKWKIVSKKYKIANDQEKILIEIELQELG